MAKWHSVLTACPPKSTHDRENHGFSWNLSTSHWFLRSFGVFFSRLSPYLPLYLKLLICRVYLCFAMFTVMFLRDIKWIIVPKTNFFLLSLHSITINNFIIFLITLLSSTCCQNYLSFLLELFQRLFYFEFFFDLIKPDKGKSRSLR